MTALPSPPLPSSRSIPEQCGFMKYVKYVVSVWVCPKHSQTSQASDITNLLRWIPCCLVGPTKGLDTPAMPAIPVIQVVSSTPQRKRDESVDHQGLTWSTWKADYHNFWALKFMFGYRSNLGAPKIGFFICNRTDDQNMWSDNLTLTIFDPYRFNMF